MFTILCYRILLYRNWFQNNNMFFCCDYVCDFKEVICQPSEILTVSHFSGCTVHITVHYENLWKPNFQ